MLWAVRRIAPRAPEDSSARGTCDLPGSGRIEVVSEKDLNAVDMSGFRSFLMMKTVFAQRIGDCRIACLFGLRMLVPKPSPWRSVRDERR